MTLETTTLFKDPVYRQLARHLRAEIERGSFGPGDRFPSERELAERQGISRATANKVISTLIAERLIELRPGVGTFVVATRSLHTSLREMESFTEHARSEGFTPQTRVLEFRRRPARALPDHVRGGLGLETQPEEPVLYVERLRLADAEPVILEHRWVLEAAVPGLTRPDLEGSFYRLLESRGLRPSGERHAIRAQNLAAEHASALRVPPGSAALVVEGPGLDERERPVWYQVLHYRGDRYELKNEVHPSRQHHETTVSFRKP